MATQRTTLTALAALMFVGLSGLFASSPAFASDPPGDCWQGALSHDPQHCLVLEALQREGTVEVDGIFRAPEGGILVYLSKPKPEEEARLIGIGDHRTKRIEKATSDLLKAKLAELVAQSPDSFNYEHRAIHVCVFRDENDRYEPDAVVPYADADEAVKAKYRECLANSPPWATQWMSLGLAGYGDVVLVLAEAETHKQVTGWASWTTLWPLESGLVREAVDYTGPFDVSELDTENIPAPCEVRPTFHFCMWKELFPHLDIVSVERDGHGWYTTYILIANLPTAESEVAAAKVEIAPHVGRTPDKVVFVPVRHTFEEQWRAEIILTRFAESSGNTLGITKASMSSNWSTSDEDVFVNGYQESTDLPSGGQDLTTWQAFVALEAPDAQSVADALPDLLRQLDIPPTTVGIVRDTRPETGSAGRRSGGGAAAEDAASAREYIADTVDENRPWVVAASSAAAIVLAGGIFVVVRRVRRLWKGH